jgi:hypothetical protein
MRVARKAQAAQFAANVLPIIRDIYRCLLRICRTCTGALTIPSAACD